MLINFSVKNWKSFKNEIEIDLRASNERRHNTTITRIKKHSLRLLPISIILGVNASGKSNFIKAIEFCKYFITSSEEIPDEKPLGYCPFKLDKECLKKETEFVFSIIVYNEIYGYSFSLLDNCVSKEALIRLNKTSDTKIFERSNQKICLYKTNLKNQKEANLLKNLTASVPSSLLFLTYTVREKLQEFQPIYDWFQSNLQIISSKNRFEHFGRKGLTRDSSQVVNKILKGLDFGIDRLNPNTDEQRKQEILQMYPTSLKSGFSDPKLTKESISIKDSVDKESLTKSISIHESVTGKEVPFDLNEESEGMLRVMHLAPALYSLTDPETAITYVIDDFDRSLHSNLTHYLINYYLSGCDSDNRSQLIFSSHDITLLDLNLFRIDEIWLTERENDGSTTLIPLCDYGKNIKDKKLITDYRLGRFSNNPIFNLHNRKLLKMINNRQKIDS